MVSGPGPLTVEAGGRSLGGRSGPPPRTVVDSVATSSARGGTPPVAARARTRTVVVRRSIAYLLLGSF